MANKSNFQDEEMMNKNPLNWKWMSYYNPDDKRIFVPKKFPGLGYTLNFGNFYSYVVIIGFIFLIIFLTVFIK